MPKSVHPVTHVQSSASSTWTITHGLNCMPCVGVKVHEDGVLTEILPKSITYPDTSTVVVEFTVARTGEARLA